MHSSGGKITIFTPGYLEWVQIHMETNFSGAERPLRFSVLHNLWLVAGTGLYSWFTSACLLHACLYHTVNLCKMHGLVGCCSGVYMALFPSQVLGKFICLHWDADDSVVLAVYKYSFLAEAVSRKLVSLESILWCSQGWRRVFGDIILIVAILCSALNFTKTLREHSAEWCALTSTQRAELSAKAFALWALIFPCNSFCNRPIRRRTLAIKKVTLTF